MTELLDAQEVGAAPPEWVRNELGAATGNGIRVAVLDSGWDRSIGDPRVLPGVGFVDPRDDFALARNDDDQDVLGHGTACAGVILDVAPDARVIPVKVFGNKLETSPGTLEAALHWAVDAGVQVINVSLGTRLEGTLRNLYMACERARQAGIIVVAAGHNANDWSYPAIFENVIGVAAGRFESPWHFHYRADHAHECEGWGVERPVLWIGGERVVRHGTSFAAPGITGVVCLILERHPGAKLEDVREMLSRFALPGGDVAVTQEFELPEVPGQRKPAGKSRKRTSAPAEAPAAGKGKKPRRRAAAPAAATPAAADTRPRKRTTKAPDEAAPAEPARKPRKRAATPARAEAEAPSARPATKPRKRTAAAPASATADRKPRTRTAAPAKAADKAPSKVDAKSRKRTAAETKTADAKQPKRAPAAAQPADEPKPAKPAARRKRVTART